MEAVYSRGTVAISLDASQPSFRFHASGQSSFSSPLCFAAAILNCGRSGSIGSGDREKPMPQGCRSIKAISLHVGVGKEVWGCLRPNKYHC